METGSVSDCSATSNPSKSVKGQEIKFNLKATNPIPY